MSIDRSWTDELFGTPGIQKASGSTSGDVTDARGDAHCSDCTRCPDHRRPQASEDEDSAADKDGNECAAAESDDDIAD